MTFMNHQQLTMKSKSNGVVNVFICVTCHHKVIHELPQMRRCEDMVAPLVIHAHTHNFSHLKSHMK